MYQKILFLYTGCFLVKYTVFKIENTKRNEHPVLSVWLYDSNTCTYVVGIFVYSLEDYVVYFLDTGSKL